MAEFHTYDPADVIVSFRGRRITGFMDGTFVNATRDEQAATKHIGSDGIGTRAMNRNRGGTVTLTLMQSAIANDILSADAATDELTGAITGELTVKDVRGTTLVADANAWIQKLPDVVFGKEVQGREWTFDCPDLAIFAGGSVT